MNVNPFRFLQTASIVERRALLASGLGWMLDGMDITLYAMVLPALMKEFNLSTAAGGFLTSVTLIAAALGGILFGILADKMGRRTILMVTIAIYSIFTAACGLSRGVFDLAIFRALLGLGMGGQWAAGAALVAETWRDEHRGKALGFMQSGYAIGYALAALTAAIILPRWGWRTVFFIGLLPAALTFWIRQRVEESPLWTPHQDPASATSPRINWSFIKTYRRMILITLLMNSAALFAWWGLFSWIPAYLALPVSAGGRGLSVAASSEWIIIMQVGMWLGYVSFGYVSDAVGRRVTYVTYLLVATVLVPLYAQARDPRMLLVLGPLLAFFGTGHFSGFGIITAELFPTSFRASAMGLTYNFGRGLSAAAPWAIGAVARQHGLGAAFWMSGGAFLIAGLLGMAIPETRNRGMS
jgi:MFS family permease